MQCCILRSAIITTLTQARKRKLKSIFRALQKKITKEDWAKGGRRIEEEKKEEQKEEEKRGD